MGRRNKLNVGKATSQVGNHPLTPPGVEAGVKFVDEDDSLRRLRPEFPDRQKDAQCVGCKGKNGLIAVTQLVKRNLVSKHMDKDAALRPPRRTFSNRSRRSEERSLSALGRQY